MRYQNQSSHELLLDREDGKGPSVSIRSQAYLDANSKYDNIVYSTLGLIRVANGTEFSAQAANPALFSLGRAIKKDSLTAESIDTARFTGVSLAGGPYTAWGRLSWSDAGGARTADFSITGAGVHGSGAAFVFEAVGGAVFPVSAASQIDVTTGAITIAFNSSAFTSTTVDLEITYNYETVSESAYYGVTEAVMSQPMIQNRVIYVQAGETGVTDYVAGCEGQIKEDRVFMTGSNIGDMCRVTRYFYRDSTVPTKYTHSKSVMETVVAADLA